MFARRVGIGKDVILIIIWGVWIFSLLFLRKWHILGPVSFRNFAGIIIVPIAFFILRSTKITNVIKLYFLWNAYYIIINSLKGVEVIFTNNFLAYNVISFCIIYAIPKLVNNTKSLTIITLWFVFFFVFNSFVTIYQFFNNSIAWAISSFICPMSEADLQQLSYYENADDLLSQSICSGLNGFAVTNGNFIASFIPIVTILIWEKKNIYKIVGLIILMFGVASAFCTQQRMCFLLVALYIMYVIHCRVSSVYKTFLFVFALLFVLLFIDSSLFEISSYGRLLSTDSNGRSQTWEMTEMYFTNMHYFLTGNMSGNQYAEEMMQTMGHNCFLDALRRGGILSLVIYIILFFVVIFEIKNVIIESKNKRFFFALCFALAALFNILYSFTHSSNIISGNTFFWLSYSLMHASLRIEANNS